MHICCFLHSITENFILKFLSAIYNTNAHIILIPQNICSHTILTAMLTENLKKSYGSRKAWIKKKVQPQNWLWQQGVKMQENKTV